MKPAKFEYHAPRSLEEVIGLLGKYGEDARILAGGQSLVPLMNFRILQPRALISINHCQELSYLRRGKADLVCGALTRQAEAQLSPEVQQLCPLLAAALPWIGGISNRNRGTVCGSLAHADPLAELPAVAVALDATFMLAGVKGRREVGARDFFLGELTTCVEPGEMVEAVKFPSCGKHSSAAFVEVGNRWHGFAVVGVAAHLDFDGKGRCTSARLAAIGVGETPVRLSASEAILAGAGRGSDAVREAAQAASRNLNPPGGFHADPAYRLQVLETLVERAVDKAWRGKEKH